MFTSFINSRQVSGLLSGRRRHHGLLGTAAGEDVGLKELPDRESVREVLAGGHEPFEVDEGAHGG